MTATAGGATDRGCGNVVFVSSTCSDLIDVRRELELFLQGLGLTPFLSDSDRESFEITDGEQKLPACLGNVAKACCVVVILSQRYGTTAQGCGKSYTQLEYEAAIRNGIPVCFFVRQPLFDAYDHWKSEGYRPDGVPACPWVPNGEDVPRLLEFIRERDERGADRGAEEIADGASEVRDGLVFVFRSVVDLKSQLRHYLRRIWASALFDEAKAAGRLPFIQVALSQRPTSLAAGLCLELTNIGPSPAIFSEGAGAFLRSLRAERGTLGEQHYECRSWAPRRPAVLRSGESCLLRIDGGTIGRFASKSFHLCVRYITIQGPEVMDVYHVAFVHTSSGDWRLRFVGQELVKTRPGVSP
ncbi:MAG: DUF4062 domain-containing protein [Planctomycetes bacterium]|nr:DUF4062 domain-containing protein [Planctomycetota bacterium]